MIKTRISPFAAACALALLSAAPAHAQSSVTLFGELDAGLGWLSNVGGHSQYRATSGLIDGSYWGLQGSEDLGGGNKAIFTLERGFSVTSGADQNDHPYFVGLAGDNWGTVTLGHQYDSVYDYLAPLTLTGSAGGTAFAHPLDNDNTNNTYLARNSVKYKSPAIGGLTFGGMYAFSNAAGQFSNNRAYSIGMSYQNGPFNAGAAWLHVNGRGNQNAGAYDAVSLPGQGRSVMNAIVRTQNTFGVGASYAIGDLTLGAAWSRSLFSGVTDADSGNAAPSIGFSNYEVNAQYQLTPAVALAGMYDYTKVAGGHWNQGGVQAVYRLSKRTDTYVEALYQRANGDLPAVINSAEPSASHSQALVGVGIRHHF